MSGAEPFLLAAAVGMQTVSAISQANAASSASKYNASVAAANAKIATDQANSAAEQQRIDNYRKLGSIRAGAGASGIAATSGSPMDVLADSYTQGEYDVQSILYNGSVRAAGYTNQSSLDTATSKNQTKAGYMNASTALLSGGAKAYSSFDDAGYFN